MTYLPSRVCSSSSHACQFLVCLQSPTPVLGGQRAQGTPWEAFPMGREGVWPVAMSIQWVRQDHPTSKQLPCPHLQPSSPAVAMYRHLVAASCTDQMQTQEDSGCMHGPSALVMSHTLSMNGCRCHLNPAFQSCDCVPVM